MPDTNSIEGFGDYWPRSWFRAVAGGLIRDFHRFEVTIFDYNSQFACGKHGGTSSACNVLGSTICHAHVFVRIRSRISQMRRQLKESWESFGEDGDESPT